MERSKQFKFKVFMWKNNFFESNLWSKKPTFIKSLNSIKKNLLSKFFEDSTKQLSRVILLLFSVFAQNANCVIKILSIKNSNSFCFCGSEKNKMYSTRICNFHVSYMWKFYLNSQILWIVGFVSFRILYILGVVCPKKRI